MDRRTVVARRAPGPPLLPAGESARSAALWQSDVRVRALERRSHRPWWARRLRVFAWFAVLVAHVLGYVVLRQMPEMRPSERESFLQVELLDAAPAPPPMPEPVPRSPKPLAAENPARAAPRIPAPPAAAPAAPSVEAEPPVLFNRDGSANVPDDLAEQLDRARPRPNFIPFVVEPSPILADKRPLKVRPNHFARYWNGTDGKPLHETVWKYVTATKEFDVPWGGRWACTLVLVVVACGDVPRKPWSPPQTWKPATELDER